MPFRLADPKRAHPTHPLLDLRGARAVSLLSRELSARAIVIPAHSGMTARMVSAERPGAPIIAVTDDPATCRRLALH